MPKHWLAVAAPAASGAASRTVRSGQLSAAHMLSRNVQRATSAPVDAANWKVRVGLAVLDPRAPARTVLPWPLPPVERNEPEQNSGSAAP